MRITKERNSMKLLHDTTVALGKKHGRDFLIMPIGDVKDSLNVADRISFDKLLRGQHE